MNDDIRSSNVYGENFFVFVILIYFVLRHSCFVISSFIKKREHQFGFGDNGVVHNAMAFRFCKAFTA